MSDGYYAPHPRLVLDRPLVLVGHPGSGVDQVGRMMAGRTGLAFNDVERSAESLAGESRSSVLVRFGLERLREWEARALERAIRRRPFGVVVMESGLLADDDRRDWLQEQARIVYVRRDDATLLARIGRQLELAPGSLPEFVVAAPRRVEELRAHLRDRERALCEISVIVEAGDTHPSTVATGILASLDHLVGVQRVDG
jgi:shikimate kinase